MNSKINTRANTKALQLVDKNNKNLSNQSESLSKMAETNINLNLDSLIQNIHNFEAKREQDIDFFIDQFDQIAAATEIPANLKIILLKTKLAGHAKQVLINSPDLRDEQNYDNLKLKLKQAFQTHKSFAEAEQKFSSIQQLPTQSIEDFTRQFNIAAQKYLITSGHANKSGAKELLQSIKLTKFVDCLRPDIAFEIRKIGPETFDDAFKLAKKIELAFNNNKTAEVNSLSNMETSLMNAILQVSNDQNKKMTEIQEQINNLKLKPSQNSAPQQQYNIPPTTFCHICDKNNHNTKDCFFNKKNDNNKSRSRPNTSQGNYTQPMHKPRNSKNYWQNTRQPRQHQNYFENRLPHNSSQTSNFQPHNNVQNYYENAYQQNSQGINMPHNFQQMPLMPFPPIQNAQQNFVQQATHNPNFMQNWGYNAQPSLNYPKVTFPNESINPNNTTTNFNPPQTHNLN